MSSQVGGDHDHNKNVIEYHYFSFSQPAGDVRSADVAVVWPLRSTANINYRGETAPYGE